jgi:hypothetical protein
MRLGRRAPENVRKLAVAVRVALTDLATHESSEPRMEHAIAQLREDHHGVDVVTDQERESGRGYYRSLCFKLFARVADEWLDIGDGGDVDWTARLLSGQGASVGSTPRRRSTARGARGLSSRGASGSGRFAPHHPLPPF